MWIIVLLRNPWVKEGTVANTSLKSFNISAWFDHNSTGTVDARGESILVFDLDL